LYEQATATDYRMSPGGDAMLVALTLAGLGLDVALSGSPIGEDPMGDYLFEKAGKEGVKIIAPRAGKTAITAIVLDGNKRSTVTFHDNTPEEEIPIPEDDLRASKYVYVDGCFGRNGAVIAGKARGMGIKTQLNLDLPSIPAMGLYDTVIAGEAVSKRISREPAEAARKIHEINRGLAIVTLGEKGCICCDGSLRRVPAIKVDAVDTTGAGAAFAAAFIYARLKGEPLDACLEFACAAGAYKSLARGSYRRFTAKDIYEFIRKR
jgi:sugar/nucleoside kinase (ribokinase family)